MSNDTNTHAVKYRTYFFVLLALIILTVLSVSLTNINLGGIGIAMALIVASIKSALVLWHFMHIKYENRLLRLMIGFVLFVFVVIMVLTFLDYSFQ